MSKNEVKVLQISYLKLREIMDNLMRCPSIELARAKRLMCELESELWDLVSD